MRGQNGAWPRPSRLLLALRRELAVLGDPERARGAQAYMKSAMPFHGVGAVPLRAICRGAFAGAATSPTPRRFAGRSSASSGGRRSARRSTPPWSSARLEGRRAVARPRRSFPSGRRWSSTGPGGTSSTRSPPTSSASSSERSRARCAARCSPGRGATTSGRRRSAILCQLGFKEKTDLDLLHAAIEPSLGSKEFFLRKAIGWALRQYARTDPVEVRRYVAANADRLSGLSRREATKHLG